MPILQRSTRHVCCIPRSVLHAEAVKRLCSAHQYTCWFGNKDQPDACPLISADGTLLQQGCEQPVRFVCRKREQGGQQQEQPQPQPQPRPQPQEGPQPGPQPQEGTQPQQQQPQASPPPPAAQQQEQPQPQPQPNPIEAGRWYCDACPGSTCITQVLASNGLPACAHAPLAHIKGASTCVRLSLACFRRGLAKQSPVTFTCTRTQPLTCTVGAPSGKPPGYSYVANGYSYVLVYGGGDWTKDMPFWQVSNLLKQGGDACRTCGDC